MSFKLGSNSLKNGTIKHIIDLEGGYGNDPGDSGGETNWGVTVRVAREYGYHGAMIDMPRSVAFDIYSEIYWDAINLDDVEDHSQIIAKELADTGVNMGTGRALNCLQGAFYIELTERRQKDERFAYGWLLNRVN